MTRHARNLTAALLAALILAAGLAQAAENTPDRRGFFAGLDLGVGGAALEWEQDGVDHDTDENPAAGMTLRLGYHFSPVFALTLDTRGVGFDDDGHELDIKSTVLMAKFHPGGGGFFLRAGAGHGCITSELDHDATETDAIELDDEHALMIAFGLGYEWMVSDSFSLGLALDARGAELDDMDAVKDIRFGESTLGLTMNWFF